LRRSRSSIDAAVQAVQQHRPASDRFEMRRAKAVTPQASSPHSKSPFWDRSANSHVRESSADTSSARTRLSALRELSRLATISGDTDRVRLCATSFVADPAASSLKAALRFLCLPLLFFSLLLPDSLFAQTEFGSINGTVIESWEGKPLPGVTVTVRGTTLATTTDSQGRFQVNPVAPGEHTLRFSKSGYAAATVTEVRVLAGQQSKVDGVLRPEFYDMEEYEVTAEELTQQTEQILFERQKAVAMTEALGSDFLARVGAGNAAESIAKVSGATIVEGKFAVIRGLNDRYVTTTLNGANIPSADPYRQSASLDLFPSQVIDRVVVAKTFTPDQPGTFTGGGIDIVTKSFPEKPFLSLSLGGAYNTQSSFNSRFPSYRGGGLDWAGMDDGARALPSELVGRTPPDFPGFSTGPASSPAYAERLQNALSLSEFTRALGATEFAPTREASPMDHNFSAAGGGSTKLWGGPFGYFAGVSYKHDYSFYEDGVVSRYWNGTQLKSSYRDSRSLSIVNWSTMVNLAYQAFENHKLGFTFFYNQNGSDDVRVQDEGFDATNPGFTVRKFNLYYTERNLNTYQVKGEHLFPRAAGLKFDWLFALTGTTQDEPDARFFNDTDDGGGYATGGNAVPSPSKPTRYFRGLGEDNQNVKLDWTVPFHLWAEGEAQFKFGLFESDSSRTFDERQFYYDGRGGYNNDPNFFLAADRLGLVNTVTNTLTGSIAFDWGDFVRVFDSRYSGNRGVQAGYVMLDLPVVKKLKLVGGARYETTDMSVHSESYLPSSITSLRSNNSLIVQNDLLPSVGVIYSIRSNMNFRVSYSQTIARPTFREMAAYYSYDPTIGDFIEGNPRLQMTSIDNYDVRWEWFPRPGEVYSVSAFYKDLQNAIERSDLKVDAEVITFKNRPAAKIYGLEFEARKNLDFLGERGKPFSLGGNLSLVQSEAELLPDEVFNKRHFFPGLDPKRPLFDQSPYIANVDLSYSSAGGGATASLICNVAGPRISITKLNAPDVYEQPAPTLDFVASKKIGRHATVKFAAKNLFDPRIERTYGENSSLLYSSYRKGRAFGLSLSYDF
jgi:outer membrane receptor protein involved in Fe transport